MADPVALVAQEIEAIQALIDQAGDDQEALLRALDRLTQLHEATRAARQYIADVGPATVTRALLSGVDPDDLRQRPYEESVVRRYAREAGLPPRKPGPRRRPLPPQS